jgi:adenosylhomocysteine nucleosidase
MGDVLMVDEIVTPGEPLLRIDLRVEQDERGRSGDAHVGRLLTVDRIVASADEKKRLAAEHEALAVDMETYAVASVCRETKTRCLAFRVISDVADEELPRDVVRLANQRTWAGTLGALSGALVRRPSSAGDMLRLKAQANACGDRLAQFLLSAFERLP